MRDGQTFGIEFELTGSQYRSDMDLSPEGEWYRIAEALRRALSEALPGKVGPSVFCSHGEKKDYSLWNVEYDSSVGWEIISRKLKNQEGYEEVVVACAALESARKSLGLKVNHRTGTHVHLGWLGKDTETVLQAIRLARLFEPALATLVSPSRIAEFCDGNYEYLSLVLGAYKRLGFDVRSLPMGDVEQPVQRERREPEAAIGHLGGTWRPA